jgi:hypothetical protein
MRPLPIRTHVLFTCALAATLAFAPTIRAQGAGEQTHDADALAQKLANPVGNLISVPFQENLDFGIGPNDGWRSTVNVQPVIPVELNADWNLIQRVIVPVVYQQDVIGNSSQSGFGDIVASTFFSPKAPTAGGLIWGAGPVFLLPTATNDAFASKKWGAGPTVVLLKQEGKFTYGALINHVASFAGSDSRPNFSATSLQPFLTYGAGRGRSYSISTETTYDWKAEQWTVPVIVSGSQVLKLGGQLVSVGAGIKTYLKRPSGSSDFGLRLSIALLFPK